MTLNTLTSNNFKFFGFEKEIILKKAKTKENADIFVDYLCDNVMFKSLMFPNSLKLADITPLHKKGRKLLKEDSSSVSILPTLSKFFEMICSLKYQLSLTMFSQNNNADFEKTIVFNIANSKYLKNGKNMALKETLLIDLSKAFDCLDHKLVTAKLNAYSVNLPALRLIHDYLSNRKQNKN